MKRAVDFDETMHEFEWSGFDEYDPGKVEKPVPRMIRRIRRWLAQGDDVVVLTARVWSGHPKDEVDAARAAIEAFCLEHLGKKLTVTSEKDPYIEEIYDDKAIRVEKNTGRLIGPPPGYAEEDEPEEDSIGAFLA